MGRVRNKTVKKAAALIINKYYGRMTLDFHSNKQLASEVALISSKRLRNKIAGFATHLMRRLARGNSVRGISLKLQEEERERKDNYVPEVSALAVGQPEVDSDTKAMLRAIDHGKLQVQVTGTTSMNQNKSRRQQ
jgi:small subunit ribosomal protein S17e